MKFEELKEILELTSVNGLINEAMIKKDGTINAVDPSKTIVVDIKYKTEIDNDIGIGNIAGLTEVLSKFTNNALISVVDNKLHIEEGKRFANVTLSQVEQYFIKSIPEESSTIICKNINPEILHKLSKLRPEKVIDSNYFLTSINKEIYLNVGKKEEENDIGDIVGNNELNTNESAYFTMNITEAFKSVKAPTNIYYIPGMMLKLEYSTDKYEVKYYLAPRIE